jgi:hypothetical protein
VDAGLPADRLEVSIAMEPPAEETLPGEVPRAPRRIRIAATGPLSRAILDRFAAASGGSADPGEVDPGEGVP